MFDNSGEKVKGFATVVMVLNIIGAVVTLISGIVAEAFFIGLLSAALMVLSAWISGIVLYAIGEAAENTNCILSRMNAMDKRISDLAAREEPKKAAPPTKMPEEPVPAWKRVQQVSEQVAPAGTVPKVVIAGKIPVSEEKCTCSSCGALQKIERQTCFNCGVTFE